MMTNMMISTTTIEKYRKMIKISVTVKQRKFNKTLVNLVIKTEVNNILRLVWVERNNINTKNTFKKIQNKMINLISLTINSRRE